MQSPTILKSRQRLERLLIWRQARLSQGNWTHLTTRDVAKVWDVEQGSVWNMVKSRLIPPPDFMLSPNLHWTFTTLSDWLRAKIHAPAKPHTRDYSFQGGISL